MFAATTKHGIPNSAYTWKENEQYVAKIYLCTFQYSGYSQLV